MLKSNFKISLFIFLFVLGNLKAQLSSDALRYTQLRSMGSARMTGVNGAMGSIGGDFAAIGINPAGIGVFRKSDFSFSFWEHPPTLNLL